MILVCLLSGILATTLLGFPTMGQKQQSDFSVSNLKDSALVKRLFDAESIDTNGAAVWKPNFSDSQVFELNIGDDGFCHTELDTAIYYLNDQDSCVLLVFSTSNGDDCHACSPTLSVATFGKLNSSWHFERMIKNFSQGGAYGNAPDISLTGPRNDILELDASNSGNGLLDDYAAFYNLYSLEPIFNSIIYQSNEGTDEPHYSWTRTITFINPLRESGYYDLKIVETGTRPIEENKYGSKIRRTKLTETLRWNEASHSYLPIK